MFIYAYQVLTSVFFCQTAKAHGCQNILALRGDPPAGTNVWTPVEGGFSNAIELVRYIRERYGDYFCISVAGFPAGHPETLAGEEDQEMEWLKEKVEAGADFIFTQMFYDVDLFLDWVRRVRKAGITVPIVPGEFRWVELTSFPPSSVRSTI